MLPYLIWSHSSELFSRQSPNDHNFRKNYVVNRKTNPTQIVTVSVESDSVSRKRRQPPRGTKSMFQPTRQKMTRKSRLPQNVHQRDTGRPFKAQLHICPGETPALRLRPPSLRLRTSLPFLVRPPFSTDKYRSSALSDQRLPLG